MEGGRVKEREKGKKRKNDRTVSRIADLWAGQTLRYLLDEICLGNKAKKKRAKLTSEPPCSNYIVWFASPKRRSLRMY